MNNPSIGTSDTEGNKQTSLIFWYMKEWHYKRPLYRDEEIEWNIIKPSLYVEKWEFPELWELMKVLEQLDINISWIKHIVLRLIFETITNEFFIEYYTDSDINSEKSAWEVRIFWLNPEQVIELVKAKIFEAQKLENQ